MKFNLKFLLLFVLIFFLVGLIKGTTCVGTAGACGLYDNNPSECINHYVDHLNGSGTQCAGGSPSCLGDIGCTISTFDPFAVNLPPWYTDIKANKSYANQSDWINFSSVVNDDGLVDYAWFADNFQQGYNSSDNQIYGGNSAGLRAYYQYGSYYINTTESKYLNTACIRLKSGGNLFRNASIIVYNTYVYGSLTKRNNSIGYSNYILNTSINTTMNKFCFGFDNPPLLEAGKKYFIAINKTHTVWSSDWILYADYGNPTYFSQFKGYSCNMQYDRYSDSQPCNLYTFSSTKFAFHFNFSVGGSALTNRTNWSLNDAVKSLNVSIQMPAVDGNYMTKWCARDTTELQACYYNPFIVRNGGIVDPTLPIVNITNPPNNSKMIRDIWIDGSASDNQGLQRVYAQFTQNSTWINISECNSMDLTSVDCHWVVNNFTAYPSGAYQVRLIAIDILGNAQTSNSRTYTLDNGLPIVISFNITYPGGKSSARTGQNVWVQLNLSDPSTGMNTSLSNPYYLNSTNINSTMIFNTTYKNLSANATSLWNVSFKLGTSPDGSNLTEYFIWDNSSNTFDYWLRIIQDDTPPAINQTEVANENIIWNNSYVIFSANFTDNFKLDNWTVSINTSNVWTNVTTQNFYWATQEKIEYAVLKYTGNYSVRIFSYDDAGNMNMSENIPFEVRGNEPNLLVTNIFPEYDAILTTYSTNFTFNYTGGTATNCSLILTNDTASVYNQTINSPSENTSLNFSQLDMLDFNDTSFSWETECCLQRGETYCFRDLSSLTINTSYTVPQNITIEWIYPTSNQTIPRNRFTNMTFNVTCNNVNCGNISVYLDPTTTTSITSIFDDGESQKTSSCSAYTTSKTGSTAMTGRLGSAPGTPKSAYYYFNISTIPAEATITNLTLNISVDSVSSATSCHIYNLDTANNSQTATTLWTDIGDGTNYVYNSAFCQTAGFKTINLGTNATGNATNFNISKGWFGIGMPTNMSCGTGTPPNMYFDTSENSSYAPTLIITYTTIGGKGLINNTIGAQPFYQNTTNPINISLNAGQSQLVTWWVNATGDNSTSYNFFAYANITLNESVNDMTDYLNLTIENVLVDSTKPYFTFIPVNQTLELNVTGLNVNFTATDETAFGSYKVDDDVNFTINSTGWIINATKLMRRDYILNVSINDTSGNVNYTLFNVSVQDTRKPYFTSIPANATLEYKTTGLNVDFNAYDVGVGFGDYKVNDTTKFTINTTGGLINATSLNLGNYYLNVSINDTQGLVNETLYNIFVNDTVAPVFTTINNISIYTNQSVLGDYSATDLDTITWNLNDTTKFSINTTGDLINSTSLSVGVYYLIVYINDSSNNRVSKDINITVLQQLDVIPPTFTYISNITHYTNQSVFGNFTATDETSFGSYAINDTTKFSINTTGDLINLTTMSVGIIYVNISINDTSNNILSVIINITTLNQVHIFPNIIIVFPTNNTNTTDTDLDINYTISDDISIDSCWYSNNSGLNNYSLTCGVNITSATWLEGLNNLTLYVNDTNNNVNSTKVSFRLDTTYPYLTENLNTQVREYKYQNLSYDINSSDSGVGVDCFAVNDTTKFGINCAGLLINSTTLNIGTYFVNITFNDTLNNTNSTILQVNVSDTTPPIFTGYPTTSSLELNITDWDDNYVAIDNDAVSCFAVNDTTKFQINCTGNIKNATRLGNGTYFVNVTVNDTFNNINSTITQIDVIDSISPYWLSTPSNVSIYTNQSVQQDYDAFDDGVNYLTYTINNTINFNINSTGGLTNITTLSATIYYINLSVNDSNGFEISTIILVNVSNQVDTTLPKIDILTPINNSNYSYKQIEFSINATDDIAVNSCWYTNNSGLTNYSTSPPCTIWGRSWLEGINNVTVWVNDTSGNENHSSVTFTVDTIKPYFINASNQNIYTNESAFINISAVDNTGGVGFGYCAVNDTINFQINSTCGLTNKTTLTVKQYFINVSINDTVNNTNFTVVWVNVSAQIIIDTTKPYFTFTPDSQTLELNFTGLGVNFTATDETSFGSYAVNDTTNFQINSTGWIKNITMLINKTYFVNITINDSSNNLNSTIFKIDVNDTLKPYFNPLPVNQTIYTNQSLRYDINAFDVGVAGIIYFVNDTINFLMNSTGGLNNITTLTIQNYTINISINDTQGNVNSSMISVSFATELDLTAPTFVTISNVSINDNQSVNSNFDATDLVAFDCWVVNDTKFSIDCTGQLTNISTIPTAIHYINLTINDTSNNLNSIIIWVNVTNTTYLDNDIPYFTHLINNISYFYHIGFNYDFNATDNISLGSYAVNDSRFTINSSGYLTNSSQLAVRSYYVNISINDTSANYNSTMLNISVNQSNSIIYMSIAGSRANSSKDNNTNINFSAELILGFTENITILINDSISANNSLITSNTTKITEVGNDYNVTAIYYGNTNFSKASETWWLDVTEYVSSSGGGGGGSGLIISARVCNITYYYLINNSFNNTIVYNYLKEVEPITMSNLLVYKNNWQGLCSDKINKTLLPKFVCESIYKFILKNNYNYTQTSLESLRTNISKNISISKTLLNHYLSDYYFECYKTGYSKKLPVKDVPTLILFEEIEDCNLKLPGALDISLPFPNLIIGNYSCPKVKINRIFFELKRDNDHLEIIGLRIWILTALFLIISFFFSTYIIVKRRRELNLLDEVGKKVERLGKGIQNFT